MHRAGRSGAGFGNPSEDRVGVREVFKNSALLPRDGRRQIRGRGGVFAGPVWLAAARLRGGRWAKLMQLLGAMVQGRVEGGSHHT